MGVALSGLASGMDWQSTVTALIAAERKAEEPTQRQMTKVTNQQASLSVINSLMTALQSSANTLKKATSDYYQREVTLGNNTNSSNSNISATADGTTPLGSYTFNVSRMATATQVTGVKAAAASITTSQTLQNLNTATVVNFTEQDTDKNAYGTFTINGKQITVHPTDTLQSVFDQINTKTGGQVTAALTGDKVVLTGHDTGSGQPAIELGAAADTSNFLEAMKLYTNTANPTAATVSSATTLSSVNTNTLLTNSINTGSLTGLTNGAGSFTVNGKTINYDTDTDSIRSIMNTVNNSGAGVLMNYDTGTGKLTITNQQTGSLGVSLDDSTGLLNMLGLGSTAGATTSYGVPAQFTVNGSSTVLTSNSNTLTSEVTGISGLKVTINSTGQDTATVTASTSAARTNINSFLSSFNSLNDKITSETKYTTKSDGTVSTSTLSGNREVQTWQTDLRQLFYKNVETGVSSISRLDQIGITTDATTGNLSITNQTALDNALKENPEAVAKLFNHTVTDTSSTTDTVAGLGNTVYDYIKNIIKTDGSYEAQKTSLADQLKTAQETITRMERKIMSDQVLLTESFQRMEDSQAKLQQQAKIITAYFG